MADDSSDDIDVQFQPPPFTQSVADRPETYKNFLEELEHYEKEHLPMHVVYRKIASLLGAPGDEEVLHDFLRYLPTSLCFNLPYGVYSFWRKDHRVPEPNLILERDRIQVADEGKALVKLQVELASTLLAGQGLPDTQLQYRPPLPMEIVSRIMRFSGMIAPFPVRVLSTSPIKRLASEPWMRLTADGTALVCMTEPLDGVTLGKMGTIQVVTQSQDQGWTTYVA